VGRHVPSKISQLTLPARDKAHVEWVKAFTAIFDEMKKYVMEYHTTGLVWNAKARKIETFLSNT
jgi:adenylyl cyclase-associated protein